MTQRQLSMMLSHPDPRVREYALRHAEQLLARGEEPEPMNPWDGRDAGVEVTPRGQQDFPEIDLMAASAWYVFEIAGHGAVAFDSCSDRVAHALEMERDVWYIYHDDLALLADLPDLPF